MAPILMLIAVLTWTYLCLATAITTLGGYIGFPRRNKKEEGRT